MRAFGLILLALIAGIAGGFGGAWMFHKFDAVPSVTDIPQSDGDLHDEVRALTLGTAQIKVPHIVQEYVTEQLQQVPYAERAGTADHALLADVAKEADYAYESELAIEATRAVEADFAVKAEEAVTAETAVAAITAEEALYAIEADIATRAEEADEAKVAEQARDRDRYFLADRTGLGIVNRDDEDDEDDKPKPANFRRTGLVSVETRGTNIVNRLALTIELETNRPVYVTLGDGFLELDADSEGEFVILRNGDPVFRGEFSNPSAREELRIPAGAVNTIDTPGRGTHEYLLRIAARDGRVALREVRLLAIQL